MPQEQVLSTSQLPLRRAGETDDSYAHRVQAAVVDHIKTLVKKPSGDTCEWDAMTLAGRLRGQAPSLPPRYASIADLALRAEAFWDGSWLYDKL